MQFVWWLTGVLATVAMCKFVLLVFKKLTSKENLETVLEKANNGLHDAADNVGEYLKKKQRQRKKKNRCTVTIR